MINGKGYSSFDRTRLESHWNIYFAYEKTTLAGITAKELTKEIASEKIKEKPFIDSQQVINIILTELGTKHNFHRQFNEKFPGANAGSVLGMQLYVLILLDELDWAFFETKHQGHLFSHATYFIRRQ